MRNATERELAGHVNALLDGTITAEEHARLEGALMSGVEARKLYRRYVDLHLGLRSLHGGAEARGFAGTVAGATGNRAGSRFRLGEGRWRAAVAAVLVVGWCLAWVVLLRPPATAAARLTEQAGAKFYGSPGSIPTGTAVQAGRSYALVAGMVRLAFSSGAEAIIEAPAVFEVAGPMRMVIRSGKCSVHAEGPAVGFAVDTPTTRVVDRGTRFSVDVDEAGDALVQVTEGKAEVTPGPSVQDAAPFASEQTRGTARRFVLNPGLLSRDVPFDPARLTRRLPDRIVRYTTTTGPRGGAEDLVDVTVQRGGRLSTYRYEDLISAQVIHFKGAPSRVHMTTALAAPDPYLAGGRRAGLLADRDVNTGLINPGGSSQPLAADPVMNEPEDPARPNTPGFAVRFARPVVNGPGPDIVFFELQVITDRADGDPFHVAPLRLASGLHPHTVWRYDIDKASPDAAMLEGFRLYKLDRVPASLGEMETLGHNGGPPFAVPSRLVAVGIDLSDLGYAPGERVDGLFFQDAMDDQNYVDPVWIGGLPEQETP